MSEALPDRLVLRSNPLEAVLLLLAVGAVAFLVLSRIPPDLADPTGGQRLRWLVGLIFVGVGAFSAAGSLRRLTLTREGLEEDSLFRSRRLGWRECSAFEIGSAGRRVQILFVQTATPAGEVRLRSRYGRKLEDLSAILNRFRERAMSEKTVSGPD